MDSILTEFLQRTSADPALAQDLLEAVEWNLDAAVSAYTNLHDTKAVPVPEYEYDPKDFETITEEVMSPSSGDDMLDYDHLEPKAAEVDENEASRRAMVKKKKMKRSRGLSFTDAEEVIDKFTKVAVVKQRVSSQEQVIIDEKFFHHSFIYPDFSAEDEALQAYIGNDLLEISHKRALERSGRLNWWTSTGRLPKLEPLATSGDGNCLLHAASMYMWGLHDNNLILRTALHRLLTSGVEREGLRRRWRYQTQLRNNEAGGLTFTEEEWDFEWGEILRIATNKPRRQPMTDSLRRHSSMRMNYESLEEVHIFVLAHTLRRPIIVISDRTIKDMSGQDLAPIYFGGIYLPLEISPSACYKSPVVLAYDSSHFSPLVATVQESDKGKQQPRPKYARMSSRTEVVIPLVTPDGSLLPIQFVYDPKKKDVQEKWSKMEYEVGEFPDDLVRLLEGYLNVRWIQLNVSSATVISEDEGRDVNFPVRVPKVRFPAASISQEAQPVYQRELIEKYLNHVRAKHEEELERKAAREAEREEEERKRLENLTVPCEGEGCDMFGRAATNNLCSVCYQKAMIRSLDAVEGTTVAAQSTLLDDSPDAANIHRSLVTPPPPYKPPELSEVQSLGRLSPSSESSLEKELSWSHSKAVRLQSSPALVDQRSKTAFPLQPRPLQSSENKPRGNIVAQASSQQRGKQPLLPPQTRGVNQRKNQTPDENISRDRSCSPTPSNPNPNPLPLRPQSPTAPIPPLRRSQSPPVPNPPSRLPQSPSAPNPPLRRSQSPPVPPPKVPQKPAPQPPHPTSPSKRENIPPPSTSKGTPSTTGTSSPSKTPSKPSFGGKVVVPSIFKKSSSPTKSSGSSSRGGGYARDNIKPLHLEGSQIPSDSKALSKVGVASTAGVTENSGVTVTGVKRKCKTVNCEFYGAPDRSGYCSSCYKLLKDSASIV